MTYAVLGLIAVVGVLTGLLIAKNAKLKSANKELTYAQADNKRLRSEMESVYGTIKTIKQIMQKDDFKKTDLPDAGNLDAIAGRLNSLLHGQNS